MVEKFNHDWIEMSYVMTDNQESITDTQSMMDDMCDSQAHGKRSTCES